MSKTIHTFFEDLSIYLDTVIAQNGNELDNNHSLLNQAYQQLRDMGSLKLLIPTENGGLGGNRPEWIEYNIQIAMHSGALLFLHAQHQFAISQLKKLSSQDSVQKTLTNLCNHNKGIGISLAANRQLLQTTKLDDGFVLTGKLPWVTGFNHFDEILCSFNESDTIYYVLLPFQSIIQNNKSLQISTLIETSVFHSTNTVSVSLKDWFISNNDIIAKENIQPKKPGEHPAIYNFAGAAKALLQLSKQGKYFEKPNVKIIYDSLSNEWNEYYAKIIANNCCPLELRAVGFNLAEKCATFAKMICGSAGLLSSHPLARINREIWQYSIAGFSNDQLDAYINYIFT